MDAIYKDEPYDFGDIMTVGEFLENVNSGFFIDYDGSGHPMRDGKMDKRIDVYPSRAKDIPSDATHIQWYNK